MGKITIFNHLTLDGVMQSPGSPTEDVRGGFQHGGWAIPANDAVMFGAVGEGFGSTGAILLGRRTYQHFEDYWPKQKDNPFTKVLNEQHKYVASTTLRAPLPWMNSHLLEGDVPSAVARLKAQEEKDIVVLGSGELIHTLMKHRLVDTYTLLIHPLVLGSGHRLFPEDGPKLALTLVDTKITTTGVVIATYRPR